MRHYTRGKVGAVFLSLAILFSFTGCGNDVVDDQKQQGGDPVSVSGGASSSKKEAVSYEITYQNCKVGKDEYGFGVPYHAIVEIKNTGTVDIYLKDATFDFEDKEGYLLETVSFVSSDPDIIAPDEKGYFYAEGMFDVIDENTEFTFKPNLKIEKSKNNIIRYEIFDTSKKVSNYELTMTGRIKNTTEEDASMIWICFVLYREDGMPIAAGGNQCA